MRDGGKTNSLIEGGWRSGGREQSEGEDRLSMQGE